MCEVRGAGQTSKNQAEAEQIRNAKREVHVRSTVHSLLYPGLGSSAASLDTFVATRRSSLRCAYLLDTGQLVRVQGLLPLSTTSNGRIHDMGGSSGGLEGLIDIQMPE